MPTNHKVTNYSLRTHFLQASQPD